MAKIEIGVGDLKRAAGEFVKTARALEKGATVRITSQARWPAQHQCGRAAAWEETTRTSTAT